MLAILLVEEPTSIITFVLIKIWNFINTFLSMFIEEEEEKHFPFYMHYTSAKVNLLFEMQKLITHKEG